MTKRPLDQDLFTSSPISDRQSRFLAIYSTQTSQPQDLQLYPPFASASHRILAWRKPSSQKTLSNTPRYDSGFDDDGEQYAGRKLEKLMTEMNVTGAVVVARWWGGVMLGPARFEHMVNVARDAIQQAKDAGVKKVKVAPVVVEDETKVRERLVRVLGERDASIAVLRGLLAEKMGQEPSQTAKVPEYAKMPVAVLKKLEGAKDSTIALILRKIDEAEFEAEMVGSGEEVHIDQKKDEGNVEQTRKELVTDHRIVEDDATKTTETEDPKELNPKAGDGPDEHIELADQQTQKDGQTITAENDEPEKNAEIDAG